jgi:HK97 family phage portal protein
MSGEIEDRVLSDVVWTPERGLGEPEVRSMYWNNLLLGDDGFGGKTSTSADIRITPDTALQSTVVLAACRILAETIACLPLHIYRRTEDGYRELARDIPLYKVLSFAPNEWQTKFEFFEQMVMNLTLWGNSYTRIRSGRYGAVSALDNFHPSNMDVERLENGRLRYAYMNPETGRHEMYSQDDIMHVRWTPEPDGIKGMVPVEIGREAIALARACEIHAGRFWANSARPGIVLQTDNSLSAEAAERLRDNWERIHRGVDRASRTAILTNGLKVEQVGFNAEQSQFESTRRFQSEEIARIYRLPLSLIQGQTSGSIEENGQEFVTYTLVPWLRRIESAISRSLIYNDDMFFAEFDTKGLMRGNSNARAGFYSTMLNLGLMTHNECRRAENLPPMGEVGDHHLVAMNLQPIEEALKPKDQGGGMPGMPGGGGPPPEAAGGVPSLPEVKTGKAPMEAEQGEASEKKPEEPLVEYAEGKFGRVKHVMEEGTLDLKSGEKVEVEKGKPVALIVDEESGEEVGVEISKLKPVEEKPAVEEKRGLTPQSKALYEAQEQIAEANGRWSQSDSHYMARSPFANRGLVCRNCVHYEPDGSCEIVKGSISPDAICKLWVIPPEKMVEARSPEPEEESRGADCGRQDGGRFGDGNKCQKDGDGSPDDPSSERKPAKSDDGEPQDSQDSEPEDEPIEDTVARVALDAIRRTGGFSVHPATASSPTTGYMVSVAPEAETILNSEDEVTGDVIRSFVSQNESKFDSRPSLHIGGWVDGETGKVYLDLSEQFDSIDDAIDAAKATDQIAIWDLSGGKEIRREEYDARRTKKRKRGSTDSRGLSARNGSGRDSGGASRLDSQDHGRPEEAEGRGTEEGREQLTDPRVASMLESAISVCRSSFGDSFPRVEIRSLGAGAAAYSADNDTLYVSPEFSGDVPQDGWLSCENPLLHEVSHRVHHLVSPDSYRDSIGVGFTPEQRSMIESEVSRYASTNGREFIAEYLAGRLSGHEYGEGIERLAEEVFGDVVSL